MHLGRRSTWIVKTEVVIRCGAYCCVAKRKQETDPARHLSQPSEGDKCVGYKQKENNKIRHGENCQKCSEKLHIKRSILFAFADGKPFTLSDGAFGLAIQNRGRRNQDLLGRQSQGPKNNGSHVFVSPAWYGCQGKLPDRLPPPIGHLVLAA